MNDIKIKATYESNVQQGTQIDMMALQSLRMIAGNTNTMCKLLADGFSGVTSTLNTMQGSIASTTSNMSRLAVSQTKVSSASRQASSGMRETAKSINQASSSAHASKGGFGNLWSSLMRIAKLRFLRGIIRSITQGFSEGVGNIYRYSQALGGIDASNVSGSLNSIASSFLYLKNSIGAAVAPLLQAIAPALATIVNWAVAALNAIAKLFAILGGKTTMTVAKKQATTWKDTSSSIGGATKAAKEYQNTILGFDELNVLNDTPSNGGGGGGGGGASPAYGDMFEEVPIKAEGLAKLLKQLFDKIKPYAKKAFKVVTDFVDGALGIVGNGFLLIDGLINGEPEKVRRAANNIQKILKTNGVWNWLFKMSRRIDAWFETANIDIQRSFNKAFRGIVLGAKKVFDFLYGEDLSNIIFKPLLDNLDETDKSLEKQRDQVQKNLEVWEDWADGTISLTDAQAKLGLGLKDVKKYSDEARKSAEKLSNVKGTGDLATEYEKVAGNAEKIQKGTTDAKDAIKLLNQMSPNFIGIKTGLLHTGDSADTLKRKIGNLRKALLNIDNLKVNANIKTTLTIQQAAQELSKPIRAFTEAQGGFVPRFDNGGFAGINTGQLFVANENNRPELVGRIGNRTAVANTGQMVDAMAAGVAEGFMAAQGGNENVEFNVYLDRTRLAQAVTQGQRNLNRRYNVAVR